MAKVPESGGGTASVTIDEFSDDEVLTTCRQIREGTHFPGYVAWAINEFGLDDDDFVNQVLTAESPDLRQDLVNFLTYVEEKKIEFKLTWPSMSSGKATGKSFAPAPLVKLETNKSNNTQPSLAETLPAVEPLPLTANGSPPDDETQPAQPDKAQPAQSAQSTEPLLQLEDANVSTLSSTPDKAQPGPEESEKTGLPDKDQPTKTNAPPITAEPAKTILDKAQQQTPLTEPAANASSAPAQPESVKTGLASSADKDQPTTKTSPSTTEPASSDKAQQQTLLTEPAANAAADADKAQPESEKTSSPDKAQTESPETNSATVNASLPAETTNANTAPPQQKVKTEESLDSRSLINTVAFCNNDVIDIMSSQEEEQKDAEPKQANQPPHAEATAADCSDDDANFASMPARAQKT